MAQILSFLKRLLNTFRRQHLDAELHQQMDVHREMIESDLMARGVDPAEAARSAKRLLGNETVIQELYRDEKSFRLLTNALRDVRIGARTLLKSPVFTIFAAVALSIGIGGNVIVFSYANALIFKSLRVPDPGRLVKVYSSDASDVPVGPMTYLRYSQYRNRSGSFSELGMTVPAGRTPIRTEGPASRPIDILSATMADSALFRVVGGGVVRGRGFEPDDEKAGAPAVAVINEQAARQYFPGANPIGRILYLHGGGITKVNGPVANADSPHIVVGVVSDAFEDILSVFPIATASRVYLPAVEILLDDQMLVFTVVGRLRPNIQRSQAQADMERVARQIAIESKVRISVSVERADLPPSSMLAGIGSLAALFLVVVLVVLLIACDDIAIMLVARIAARRREMGIRIALGAGRSQLLTQLVAENLLLAIVGGAGAMIFTLIAARSLDRLGLSLPESSRVVFDWHVLLFAIVMSLATTLFFGLRPALECVGRSVTVSLSPGGSEPGDRQGHVRAKLLITQIAVCTALLITNAAIARSAPDISFSNRGFNPDHVLLGHVNFIGSGYDNARQLRFYRSLVERLAETPGVEAASVVNSLPAQLPGGDYFRYGSSMIRDVAHTDSGREERPVLINVVSPGSFATVRIPLVAGRDFRPQDDATQSTVGIVSQALAAELWPNENPLGRIVRLSDTTKVEIVGVSADIQYSPRFDGDRSGTPIIYRPLGQFSGRDLPDTIMIRTAETPMKASNVIYKIVAEIDPALLPHDIRPLDEQLNRAALVFRILRYVTGLPGVFAFLLGIIGTYGTMAFLVTQRRREIGIRVALGAAPASATRAIMKEGLGSTALGILLGIACALLIALWLSRNIDGLQFFDPAAFVTTALLILGTASIACYIPARRASRVDPIIVLRED